MALRQRCDLSQAIRFLHYCIDQRHNRDKAVHNLLLSLLTDTDGAWKRLSDAFCGRMTAPNWDSVRDCALCCPDTRQSPRQTTRRKEGSCASSRAARRARWSPRFSTRWVPCTHLAPIHTPVHKCQHVLCKDMRQPNRLLSRRRRRTPCASASPEGSGARPSRSSQTQGPSQRLWSSPCKWTSRSQRRRQTSPRTTPRSGGRCGCAARTTSSSRRRRLGPRGRRCGGRSTSCRRRTACCASRTCCRSFPT